LKVGSKSGNALPLGTTLKDTAPHHAQLIEELHSFLLPVLNKDPFEIRVLMLAQNKSDS
jgi:hypothetical protein